MGRMDAFEEVMRRGGSVAIEHAGRFFMRNDPVHQSLRKIATRLDELQIPYAIGGGMALVAHGYDRTTVDVDILVSPAGLQRVHESLVGLGYLPPFKGSKNLRDVESAVRIEFLISGQYPGDGKPKPVSFPDPADAGIDIDGVRYLRLPVLIELKLASGMTSAGRIKDLADAQELIKALKLPASFADQLNAFVRDKYMELWHGANEATGEEAV
jgi:hypothetical protein